MDSIKWHTGTVISTVLIESGDKPVNGYRVEIVFPELNETHLIEVKALSATMINNAADKLATERLEVLKLGSKGK